VPDGEASTSKQRERTHPNRAKKGKAKATSSVRRASASTKNRTPCLSSLCLTRQCEKRSRRVCLCVCVLPCVLPSEVANGCNGSALGLRSRGLRFDSHSEPNIFARC
jgi:hypothetical protein